MGRLVNGFRWESQCTYTVSGVATNFRSPEVVEFPVGGGPVREALCCRGVATLTDAAVLAGRTRFGSHRITQHRTEDLARNLAVADRLLAEAVDRVSLGADGLPLIVVGGAGGIAPDHLPGVPRSCSRRTSRFANALGAAIAPVSG